MERAGVGVDQGSAGAGEVLGQAAVGTGCCCWCAVAAAVGAAVGAAGLLGCCGCCCWAAAGRRGCCWCAGAAQLLVCRGCCWCAGAAARLLIGLGCTATSWNTAVWKAAQGWDCTGIRAGARTVGQGLYKGKSCAGAATGGFWIRV